MVALKPFRVPPMRHPLVEKQERRGGIETSSSPGWAPATGRKQERRGGIETGGRIHNTCLAVCEAGTPWWH